MVWSTCHSTNSAVLCVRVVADQGKEWHEAMGISGGLCFHTLCWEKKLQRVGKRSCDAFIGIERAFKWIEFLPIGSWAGSLFFRVAVIGWQNIFKNGAQRKAVGPLWVKLSRYGRTDYACSCLHVAAQSAFCTWRGWDTGSRQEEKVRRWITVAKIQSDTENRFWRSLSQ